MLKKMWSSRVFLLFLLLIFVCFLVNIAVVVYPARLAGEAVSTLMIATAPLRDLGVPYRDYWEFKPPGLPILISSWIYLFGYSITLLNILKILVLLGIGCLIFLISKKIFSSFYTLLIGGLVIIVLFSPYLNFSFLPDELFGLFFSLAGLVAFLYLEKLEWRFFLTAFLITIAGQMKDPFLFTILAVLPNLLSFLVSGQRRLFWRAIWLSFEGFLLAILLTWLYLSYLGAMGSYFEVLRMKTSVFNIYLWKDFAGFGVKFFYTLWHSKNIVMMFQSEIVIFLLIWFSSFLLILIPKGKWKWPKVKSVKDSCNLSTPSIRLEFGNPTVNQNILAVVFYSLGSFLGFSIQGAFDFHNLIQVVPPIFFFWGIIIKSTFDNFLKFVRLPKFNFLLFPLLVIFLFPKSAYFKDYLLFENFSPPYFVKQIVNHIKAASPNTEFEDYIASKTSIDSCILSVYGWSVGETYFYAQRRPCTRFFLASFVNNDWQRSEYRESIFQNPPQAIVYTQKGADVDVSLFEQKVINFTRIIDQCYQPDARYSNHSSTDPNLYFPRFSADELKTCLKKNAG